MKLILGLYFLLSSFSYANSPFDRAGYETYLCTDKNNNYVQLERGRLLDPRNRYSPNFEVLNARIDLYNTLSLKIGSN